jgi:hypothetical protein
MMIDLSPCFHKEEPEKRVRRSRKRSGTHPVPGLSGEPMKQTDTEADEALAHIRQNTAAPIQRFFDSIAAARLEETTSHQNRKPVSPSKLGLLDMAKGLSSFLEALSFFVRRALSIQPLARIIRRVRRRRQAYKEP